VAGRDSSGGAVKRALIPECPSQPGFVLLRLVVQMIDCGITFISFWKNLGVIWFLLLEGATLLILV
jgi:hypothetical protein